MQKIVLLLLVSCFFVHLYAGGSDDEGPRAVFPSIVGCSRKIKEIVDDTGEGEGLNLKGSVEDWVIKYPVNTGIITNWDDMEKIWHHSFYSELEESRKSPPWEISIDKEEKVEIFQVDSEFYQNEEELEQDFQKVKQKLGEVFACNIRILGLIHEKEKLFSLKKKSKQDLCLYLIKRAKEQENIDVMADLIEY